ncbi:hypothetical protein EVAR_81357_1 [Eumeta japonica]|uniref:Odorant receptor n=1 Tax=Eumeta variegata TaxID=151549 RepID=A0A4C1X8S9_EUMVA|nr:hypothetical protein EVAR_81357_1 [Eumeta japonica]
MDPNFVRADNSNLPKIDAFMVAHFFKNNVDYYAAELANVKTAMYEDDSMIAKIFRVFFYITWLYMMLPMMSADCFPITHLIALNYKFVTLRHHFEEIRRVFDVDFLSDKELALRKLKAGCIEGILIHQKLLKLADEITRVFGMIMSLQVCESSAVAVLLLLRLVLAPHMNLTNAFMTYTFVTSLFILLALNLWNAGEITYQQPPNRTRPAVRNRRRRALRLYERWSGSKSDTRIASLLSNAIFYCGWHLSPLEKDKDLRRLVLFACAEAQRPLVLKAFSVQDLSYATFVGIFPNSRKSALRSRDTVSRALNGGADPLINGRKQRPPGPRNNRPLSVPAALSRRRHKFKRTRGI